jgi:hypothetical protein
MQMELHHGPLKPVGRVSTVQVRSKARRHVGPVVQLHEPQVQLSCRGMGSRPCERPPRRPNDGCRQGQGEVKTPGHGRRTQEGNLDAFGVECGIGCPRGDCSRHGMVGMVLR